MKFIASPRGSGSVRPRPTARPKRSTAESRLRALGITPKMAYAIRHWVASHSIEDNFSPRQIADEGLCHPSCFSRAKDLLLEKGLVVQLCEPTQPKKGVDEKGLAALYRFTEEAYRLVLRGYSGRAKRTSPLAFQSSFEGTSYSKHEHVPTCRADALEKAKKGVSEKRLGDEPSPVVKILLEEGLERGGAEQVAKSLPQEVDTDLLPFLLEVTREVVAKRGPRGGKPERLKVHLLRSLDPELLKSARFRQRSVGAWSQCTAGLTWESLSRLFRAHPGASGALEGLVKAKEVLSRTNAAAAGYLSAHDQVQEARRRVVDLILSAAGETEASRWGAAVEQRLEVADMRPGSIIWKRARGVYLQAEAFKWAGLPQSL